MFKGLLTLRPACPVCGLNFGGSDTGDAGAVGVIMVLGAIVICMAFWVEFHFSPPLWVHAILWPRSDPAACCPDHATGESRASRRAIPDPSHRDGLVTSGYRRFLVPGVSTLIMLLVLLGLGTWQVYRLQWKEGILAQIAAAEAAPAVPLGQDPAPYMKVSVTGRFRFDQAAAFRRRGARHPNRAHYGFLSNRSVGSGGRVRDPGRSADGFRKSVSFPSMIRPAVVTVTGYVRPRETQSWFSAADDAAARQFYTLDPQAIGSALDVSGLAPFTLVAMGPSSVGAYPAPAQHLPRPPNNHLSYVITWYGLAASLVVIFSVWVRKALRS